MTASELAEKWARNLPLAAKRIGVAMSETNEPTPNLPATQPGTLLQRLAREAEPSFAQLVPSGAAVTTLDRTTKEGRAVLFQHLNQAGLDASEMVNTVLDMVHVTVQPVRWFDSAGGEMVETFRTVIRLADGRDVEFKSMGILKSIGLIESQLRPAPWNPPMSVTLKRIPTSEGRSMYRLDPSPSEIDGTKKRK